jgi:hypothetical protein
MNAPIIVTKSSGSTEPYDPAKLCQSMVISGLDQTEAEGICSVISDTLPSETSSSHLWRTTLTQLYSKNISAAARYGLRRAMNEIGPDGFIFEKYLATLFHQEGFETSTNIKVLGKSGLYHELDVQMDKDSITHLVEAKYRNDYGTRTHLDTIMYAHARLLDIESVHPHTNIVMWVMTNSEFTTSAIQYAQTYDIHLLGWNYPQNGNLHDLIVKHHLYPISSILGLSQPERRTFVENGIVLLVDLVPYSASDLVSRFGLHPDRAYEIITALRELGL